MRRRLAQIVGLLLCTLGWGFVCCTLALDHWRVAQMGGEGGSSVVVTAWYWSDLWKDCYEDSTALVNCVDFGVLWKVKSYIQAVRGLLMVGLCLGLIGTVLTFFGLECTRIGGDQRSKDRMLMTASASHLVGSMKLDHPCTSAWWGVSSFSLAVQFTVRLHAELTIQKADTPWSPLSVKREKKETFYKDTNTPVGSQKCQMTPEKSSLQDGLCCDCVTLQTQFNCPVQAAIMAVTLRSKVA
ncbi:claudin-10-like isoform X2 [Chelmon rostratus]|uniref:claudin-10-like isoform X2 n=1 Tax=Chelmon rostratus TaxID=109905 RepID=UPI001BE9FBA2|nr:claudin-10-like isoform X2 [Chelmon rostratus]